MKGISIKELREVENQLTLIVSKLQEFIDAAETYKSGRSDKWVESDAGEVYENQIGELESLFDSADTLRADFTNFMDGDD